MSVLPEELRIKAEEYRQVALRMSLEAGLDNVEAYQNAELERVAFIAGAHALRIYLASNGEDAQETK